MVNYDLLLNNSSRYSKQIHCFIDVDDISITGELGTPYVIKNGKKIPLYISEYNEEE